MKRKILYLGIDPPLKQKNQSSLFVTHYPVIYTKKIHSPSLTKALQLESQFTHMICTSKNCVRYWPGTLKNKVLIAIGKGTAQELICRGANPMVSLESTQEGVACLLSTLDLSQAFILYPRSNLARPYLADYIEEKKIPAHIFCLYETLMQKPEPVPYLLDFDEIVFTSPSTVHSFFQIYQSIPKHVTLTSIGSITQKALQDYVNTLPPKDGSF